MFQVEARIRCRSGNCGLCIDAACRSVAASPGVSWACSSRMPASSLTLRTGGTGGRVFVEDAEFSRVTSAATATFPARSAARLSSAGVIRPRADR